MNFQAPDVTRANARADALWSSRLARERLLQIAAALSSGSAAIHLVLSPDHFAEWWGYGLFFVLAAAGQAGLAAVLLYKPWRRVARPQARRWLLATLVGGAVGNASIAVLYVVTRTAGIPLGPEVGEVEALTPAGVLSTISEVLSAAILSLLAATIGEDSHTPPLPTDQAPARAANVGRLQLFIGAGAMIALVAAIGAVPVVITAREGGMGPGSALLLGEALLVGATVLGAGSLVLAPPWVSSGGLLLSSGAMTLGAFVAAGFEDHVGLIAINGAYLVIGFAGGMVMTELFARAADGGRGRRALAVVSLLVGALAASRLAFIAAVPGLVWVALAGTFLTVLWWLETDTTSGEIRRTVNRGASFVGQLSSGLLLVAISAGIVATLASSDSTGMLAVMLSSPFGATDLAGLDASRATLLVAGLVLIVVGSIALWLRSQPAGEVFTATCAIALTALAGAGTVVLLAFIAPADVIPGQRELSGIGAVAVLATGVGLCLGAVAIARGFSFRLLAASGASVLAAVTLIVTGAGAGTSPAVSAPIGMLAAAAAGFGIGASSVALRYGLTVVPGRLKRGAAAAGVSAAAFGSFAGLQIGGGLGAQVSRGDTGMPGALVLALAAVGAAAVSTAVRPSTDRRPAISEEREAARYTR